MPKIKINTKNYFSDVKSTDWFAQYVNIAREAEIVSSGDKFAPNRPITRAESSKIIKVTYDSVMR